MATKNGWRRIDEQQPKDGEYCICVNYYLLADWQKEGDLKFRDAIKMYPIQMYQYRDEDFYNLANGVAMTGVVMWQPLPKYECGE